MLVTIYCIVISITAFSVMKKPMENRKKAKLNCGNTSLHPCLDQSFEPTIWSTGIIHNHINRSVCHRGHRSRLVIGWCSGSEVIAVCCHHHWPVLAQCIHHESSMTDPHRFRFHTPLSISSTLLLAWSENAGVEDGVKDGVSGFEPECSFLVSLAFGMAGKVCWGYSQYQNCLGQS